MARESLTEQIVKDFLECHLSKEKWTHQAHLRVGLWHLLQYQPWESLEKLRHRIKKYNVACGVENTETQGYHETITRFYLWLIHQFLQQVGRSQPIDTLADELIRRYGARSLLWDYYSKEQLMSKTARLGWVEPDLKSLQAVE
ncbi:MAG: hypothetical protein AAGF26_03930 [Cyanobacteria bacterium P01_G01_bin.49]